MNKWKLLLLIGIVLFIVLLFIFPKIHGYVFTYLFVGITYLIVGCISLIFIALILCIIGLMISKIILWLYD